MKYSLSAVILLAGLVSATGLTAGTIEPCTRASLAFYESLTPDSAVSQCSIGILLFSNFTFSAVGSGATETPNDIILNPFADAGDVGGGFGFSRQPDSVSSGPAFTIGAGQSATYTIDWKFVIDPGPVGSGADLGMDPPFGDVSITQDYCLDSDFVVTNGGLSCSGHGNKLQTLFVNVANPTDHRDFQPPANLFGNVMTIIQLNGNTQTGSSGFDAVNTTTSVTPEPVSLVLALAGLAAIGARRRFKPQG
ncbi:MAG: hypothetical protein M3N54_08565 [Acidobacteriota bacterium]|nr:hypothetical protein [Acidobacteriota bacterium]